MQMNIVLFMQKKIARRDTGVIHFSLDTLKTLYHSILSYLLIFALCIYFDYPLITLPCTDLDSHRPAVPDLCCLFIYLFLF